ncbi:Rab-GTPase-TBC domain family [Trichomonas vaginalis G3]|uniref:Rab-GTPase-TBC domain family n=1 Tax=Trichomonas vaginalis (strain ATCC PRA-98 / G3) TaxID=412133 RepID=UPI0021E58872|nr:Rab-GTPase-TBC domain family [Trichomonas vaginalis G3]KAI5526736.1 Rab-GTPase-TBC domain family [Trichomonas vaginalis G3]
MSNPEPEKMIKDQVDYDQVFGALEKIRGRIPEYSDAIAFLDEKNINKDNTLRFISWLIAFGIIDDENTRADKLFRKFQDYTNMINEEFNGKIDDPLSCLESTKAAYVIKADVDRSIGMFNKMADQLKISVYSTKYAHQHAIRILALLTVKFHDLSYTQGFDRYILTCYLLALDFTSQNCLPPTFAEAMTYYLAPVFMRMANIHRFIDDLANTTEYFDHLDKLVAAKYPELASILERCGHGSIHYALRWQLLLFADEYNARSLFLIWDAITVNRGNFDDFVTNLCIAHVLQIPLPKPNEILIEKIQTYRDWNVVQALNTTYSLMHPKSETIFNNKTLYLTAGAAALALLYFFMR